MALQVAEETKTPLMVHPTRTPLPIKEILNRLRPGDIFTHVFNHPDSVILDWNHKVRPEIWDAAKKGVIFDIGDGGKHMNFNLARAALEQGFLPHVLSTDMTELSVFAAHYPGLAERSPTLLEAMSIFLAMGLSLDDVVRWVTTNAAVAIGMPSELGTLRPGAAGDVAVLQFQEGDFVFNDYSGGGAPVQAKQKLAPLMTIRGGQICSSAL
jgi:dihydroorotase